MVLHSSSQVTTIKANNTGGLHLFINAVYGSNWRYERNCGPWVVLGDFNTARHSDEKLGRNPPPLAKLAPSNSCINSCQLFDLKHIGSHWLWHNNSLGSSRIIGRLDRVLCNQAWIDTLADSYYEYQSYATSDHAPITLHLLAATNTGPKTFKYFTYWYKCAVSEIL